MPPDDKDGAAVRFPPPLVYLIALIAGGLLHAFLLPLRLGFGLAVRVAGATGCALLGIGVMLGAIGLFKRTGQDPKPWKATPEIITAGVYAYTRNPMYLGMALVQVGFGFAFANAWMIALIPPVLVIIYAIAIRHEEAYLARKFGEPYSEYKRSVRRWV
jgi:protein-S-isoprenylcysteine O-methyltransferase Ste14